MKSGVAWCARPRSRPSRPRAPSLLQRACGMLFVELSCFERPSFPPHLGGEQWDTRSFSLLSAAIAALLMLAAPAAADDYPNRSVRIIIPFAPGGINDVAARVVATHLSQKLGKQFIAENKTGAGGVVGTELVANSPPDGYTDRGDVDRQRGAARRSTSCPTIRTRRSMRWPCSSPARTRLLFIRNCRPRI